MALADFQRLVDGMVSGHDGSTVVTPDSRDLAIEQARIRYSADRVREVVVDLVWPMAGVFGPVPDGWGDDAWVKKAEWPTGQQPPALLHVQAYRTPTGWALESATALPADAVVRLTYTAAHVLTPLADTIALVHRMPVASLAASMLCQQLATYYSGQRESAMGADVSQTESRAREFAARSKEYRTAYFVGTGQPDPYARASANAGSGSSGAAAAAAVGSWPSRCRRFFTGGVL